MANSRYTKIKEGGPMPTFSIIVPAYNARSSIMECIQSIKDQTYHDFEALVINDGSQDDTSQIVRKAIKGDTRFKLISKKNGGVSQARNTGLDYAKGKFVIFIDSDDSVLPDMLREFRDAGASSEAHYSILMCNLIQRSEARDTTYSSHLDNQGHLDMLANDIPTLITSKQILSPWAKAYVRYIIEANTIRFREDLNLGEDLAFNLDFLRISQSYKTIDYTGYVYKTDSIGSLSKKVNTQTFKAYSDIYSRGLAFCEYLMLDAGAQSAFAKYYLSSIYYGLGVVMQLSATHYKQVIASLDKGVLKQAAKSALHSGAVGVGLALPVLSNSTRLLTFFVYLRQEIKKRAR